MWCEELSGPTRKPAFDADASEAERRKTVQDMEPLPPLPVPRLPVQPPQRRPPMDMEMDEDEEDEFGGAS